MAKCDASGNDYDKSFNVTKEGKTYTFDSFESAVYIMAPACATCGVRVIGHGLEHNVTSTAAPTAPTHRAPNS